MSSDLLLLLLLLLSSDRSGARVSETHSDVIRTFSDRSGLWRAGLRRARLGRAGLGLLLLLVFLLLLLTTMALGSIRRRRLRRLRLRVRGIDFSDRSGETSGVVEMYLAVLELADRSERSSATLSMGGWFLALGSIRETRGRW